ncbi:protealysin inhibitor emfourin [Brevibacterium sp. CFH 10365]|uniref:protealysin inhibitor emfourin n=1 Tax=Brevibacterium sp. CFH 10365 TaxID=2585207 RepID=UPI0012664AF9|nr:protealysin inhibitor emfourin [Brevibacterium sp. CFH 10365]
MNEQPAEGFGRLLVERSGGIGGMLLVWEVDVDASTRRDDLGPRIAELPWSDSGQSDEAPPGADRFAYLIESRFGRVRFGESQMPPEWKQLVDEVRDVAEPQRRQPG